MVGYGAEDLTRLLQWARIAGRHAIARLLRGSNRNVR
jgi:hypothetical protein